MKYPLEAVEAVGTVVDDPLDIVGVLDALNGAGVKLLNFNSRKNEGRERVARLVYRKVYLEFYREKVERSRYDSRDTELGFINAEISSYAYVLEVLGVDISTPEKTLSHLMSCRYSVRRGKHFIRKYMLRHGMAVLEDGKLKV